ncbi:hypothetical protein ACKUT9_06915 [Mycobacterium seoulense]|uniref:hypothetical protein n=1 Tax=Mycobacterium seoulense TaxID=386911 RepID=UPI003CE839A2
MIFWPVLSSGDVMMGQPVPFWNVYWPRSVGSAVGDPTTEQPSLPTGASARSPGNRPSQLALTWSPGFAGLGRTHCNPSGVVK